MLTGSGAMRDDSVAKILSASGSRLEPGRVTRRAALAFALGSASAALLSACGGNTPQAPSLITATSAPKAAGSAPTPPTQAVVQPTSPPKTTPRAGGTLTAAIQTDLPNVDAHFNSPAAYDALWVAFDRLIYLDNKLQPQPMLAETWDVTPDYKRVTFHLRKGVQFTTGRELTSDDVKYNLLRVRDPKVGGGGWVAFSNWWTIDTPDKYTITLSSDTSRPLVFDNLETFNIIDQVTAEGPNAKSQVVGTG